MREADAGLLEHVAFRQYATLAAAAAGSLPGVACETCPAVELFEFGADAILQRYQVVFYVVDIAHRLRCRST